ncbi:MAG: hypothetical protein IJ635_07345 [Bacteroidaceae bacterium]|nr:hypothetical protein [Bacteroidaceae bacterium]
MKKILLAIAVTLAFTGAAQAITVQRLYLKNGSVLSGYIQKQDAAGNLTFASDSAEVCLAQDGVTIANEKYYASSELDKAWAEWANRNDAYEAKNGKQGLTLADVTSPSKNVLKVRILERGVVVKYQEMTPNLYVIPWDDVECIKGERRPKTQLSGINRIYTLKSGEEFVGQYAEENDSMLVLYLDNGGRQSFKLDDVVKYTFRAVNPNQDIFLQSELLDVVRDKKGSEIRGIITEQNYADDFFTVQQETGSTQKIPLGDIVEIRKEVNLKFQPIFDILLSKNEVAIDGTRVRSVHITEQGDNLVLGQFTPSVSAKCGADKTVKVTLQYRTEPGAAIDVFQLVKAIEKKSKKETSYSFSYRDLVNAFYRPTSVETSVNNITKAEYVIGEKGIFVFYDAKTRLAYPLEVK